MSPISKASSYDTQGVRGNAVSLASLCLVKEGGVQSPPVRPEGGVRGVSLGRPGESAGRPGESLGRSESQKVRLGIVCTPRTEKRVSARTCMRVCRRDPRHCVFKCWSRFVIGASHRACKSWLPA